MGNERYDFSAPKEYLTKDKAKLLYVHLKLDIRQSKIKGIK